MKTPLSKYTAQIRVVRKFDKLYIKLVELADALQNLEPGGTTIDNIQINRKPEGSVEIQYAARPIYLTISDQDRTFTLKIEESELK